jgi:hypothetical protein
MMMPLIMNKKSILLKILFKDIVDGMLKLIVAKSI